MSSFKFKCLGLIGKHHGSHVAEALQSLSDYLLELGLQVLLDEGNRSMITDPRVEIVSRETIGHRCDLAIIVGGDGTLLNVARNLVDTNTPMVGINLGHLGFLADISPDNMLENMQDILQGHYQTEQRFLLQCHVHRGNEVINNNIALNDVVIHKWNVARLIELQTYIDDHFVNLQRSDGLIIASPTGSTAYALSAGGPIIHPTLDALLIVPVCPQSMSNRPIVVSGDSLINIVVCEGADSCVRVTCDGQIPFQLEAGDRVHIRKKDVPIRLIHPAQHDHYEMLRAKLNWAETPKRRH